jgi:hypothetical protein
MAISSITSTPIVPPLLQLYYKNKQQPTELDHKAKSSHEAPSSYRPFGHLDRPAVTSSLGSIAESPEPPKTVEVPSLELPGIAPSKILSTLPLVLLNKI